MNKLFYGDNLQVLRDHISDESVDMIYLDPPFNSKADYNILFKSPNGTESQSQIIAFEDTWHWTEETEKTYSACPHSNNLGKNLSNLINLGHGDYL
jgi:site-specific DNA-methyltransferase (adenine-specific)